VNFQADIAQQDAQIRFSEIGRFGGADTCLSFWFLGYDERRG